ncbi:unnamed protein product [Rhodiola kirilowii]
MSDHQQQQLLQEEKKGGFITLPFIIANEAFEKVSSYGLLPNMILYLMQDYGMELAKGTHVLFIWSAATNFMPIVGAFIADSYLGRFLSIALGSMKIFFRFSEVHEFQKSNDENGLKLMVLLDFY